MPPLPVLPLLLPPLLVVPATTVAGTVSALTGRDLTIAGGVRVGLAWRPEVVLRDVALANAPWGARPELIEVSEVRAVLALWPLLHYFPSRVELGEQDWPSYVEVNRLFADGVFNMWLNTTEWSNPYREGVHGLQHITLESGNRNQQSVAGRVEVDEAWIES